MPKFMVSSLLIHTQTVELPREPTARELEEIRASLNDTFWEMDNPVIVSKITVIKVPDEISQPSNEE